MFFSEFEGYYKFISYVGLGEISIKKNEFDEALKFLKLADTKFLPRHGGCANGMIMSRTYVSLKYADLYLRIGDITSALNRLLDYLLLGEGYSAEAAYKLRNLLLKKYSQKQINKELDKNLNKTKIITRMDIHKKK